jgi:hypothetical protein
MAAEMLEAMAGSLWNWITSLSLYDSKIRSLCDKIPIWAERRSPRIYPGMEWDGIESRRNLPEFSLLFADIHARPSYLLPKIPHLPIPLPQLPQLVDPVTTKFNHAPNLYPALAICTLATSTCAL